MGSGHLEANLAAHCSVSLVVVAGTTASPPTLDPSSLARQYVVTLGDQRG